MARVDVVLSVSGWEDEVGTACGARLGTGVGKPPSCFPRLCDTVLAGVELLRRCRAAFAFSMSALPLFDVAETIVTAVSFICTSSTSPSSTSPEIGVARFTLLVG